MRKLFRKIYGLFIYYKSGGVAYARYLGAKVGKDCRIYTTFFGSEPFLITIGNKVTITLGVKLITHDGAAWLANDEKGRRYRYQKIVIGNEVFIGADSVIMPGVKIDDKVVVAAGSVVTKSIPEGSVVAGVPAKIIGDYGALHIKMIQEYVSDKDFVGTKNYKERVMEVTDGSFKKYMD